jgi:predicted dehydrogenase
MEAFMYRHHPQWRRARELVSDGAVGELRTVQSFFSYSNEDPLNIRNHADQGGGGLMDIGCYNVSLSRFIFGAEPSRVCGMVEYDPRFNTDRLVSAMLDFGRGSATFTCSTQLSPYQRVNIVGTTGRVEVEIPVNMPAERSARIWHAHDGTVDELVFDAANQYTLQGDLFSRAIIDNSPVPTPLDDAVANMRVIDAVIRSGRDRAWVDIAAPSTPPRG